MWNSWAMRSQFPMPSKLTVRHVIGQGLRAVIHPFVVRRAVPPDVRLPTLRLLLLMMLIGSLGPLLHYRMVNRLWLFQFHQPDATYAFLAFALAPMAWCGVTSAGLYVMAALCRRRLSPGWCDLAAVHMWMVWGMSLLFDLIHLLPNVPMRFIPVRGYVPFLMHAGWFFGFPMLLLQLLACWQVFTGRRWYWLPVGVVFALGCLAVMRVLIRPLPELVTLYMMQHGQPRPSYWMLTVVLASLGCVGTLMSRVGMALHRRWARAGSVSRVDVGEAIHHAA